METRPLTPMKVKVVKTSMIITMMIILTLTLLLMIPTIPPRAKVDSVKAGMVKAAKER